MSCISACIPAGSLLLLTPREKQVYVRETVCSTSAAVPVRVLPLSEMSLASFLTEYEKEQAELKAEVSRIESELNEYHKSKDDAIDFVNLIEKYIGIKELTYEILHELIDRIEVGEKYKYQGETYQDINIYYKFVGTVETLDELFYTENAS